MAAPERLLRPFLALIWLFQTTKSLPEVIKIGKYTCIHEGENNRKNLTNFLSVKNFKSRNLSKLKKYENFVKVRLDSGKNRVST